MISKSEVVRVREWRHLARIDLTQQLEYMHRINSTLTRISATCYRAEYCVESIPLRVYLHGYERTLVEVVNGY